jgi:hypothetical protein
MLYAIQQTTSVIKFRAKLEAAQFQTAPSAAERLSSTGASYQGEASAAPPAAENKLGFSPGDSLGGQLSPQATDLMRVQSYPAFEHEFGINAGEDIDIEIHSTLRKADEEAELRHAEEPPPPPPGMRFGSTQHRLYREEVYQGLNMQINRMKHELRDYYEQKRKETEKLVNEARKEAGLATLPLKPVATTA